MKILVSWFIKALACICGSDHFAKDVDFVMLAV